MSGFKKASKSQAKLRAAFFGPSGAGKTFSSLSIAEGLAGGGNIAVIDTERGSASKYADRFEFDVLDLEDRSINGYTEAIKMAADAGYAVLIIDSLTHAWQQLLEEVERLAKAKYRGNTWSAWSEGNPLQRRLVDAILEFPGHLIATMRSKTEWQTSSDGGGKTRPVRVGLAPEQGKGVEYEFDLLMEISTEHIGNVIKDRSGRFQDKLLSKPGREFGKALADWLSDGSPAETSEKPKPPTAAEPDMEKGRAAISSAETVVRLEKIRDIIEQRLDDGFYTPSQADDLLTLVNARLDEFEGITA